MSITYHHLLSKSLPFNTIIRIQQHFFCFRHFIFFIAFLAFAVASLDDELLILQNLKLSIQESNPGAFHSWDLNLPKCTFTGITCNPAGSIAEIELSNNGLSGPLPIRQICHLPSLEKLSIGFNSFTGIIDESLNSCKRLRYLDLGNNQFEGRFPDISSLTDLRFLYLNCSGFSGDFPWESLANMSRSLQVLSIGDNPLNRSPFPKEVTKLHTLNFLYLSNCSLEGAIPPEIGDLKEIGRLELSSNYFTGQIPIEISKLTNLWQLELYANNLTGKLPPGFSNLTNLQFFDASQNNLEGDLSELRFLVNLVSLQLFENRLTGKVPEEFGDFRRLVNLSLYTNRLNGSLPQKLGSWAAFNFIDVTENFLTGTIPPYMCRQGKMTKLLTLQNRFTGEIPENYGNCSTLIRFRVNENFLSGKVPAGIWGLPKAEIIDLRSNQLEGPITADIGRAKSLGLLSISRNRFSGKVPPEIMEASSLISIDLSGNQFTGEIPTRIGDLRNLRSLDARENKFSGSIPASLGSCTLLAAINIAQNNLSGRIPPSLGTLPSLNSLNLSANRLSGEIPPTLSSAGLSLLDLSNNILTGPIPNSLTIDAYNGSFSGNVGLCSSTTSEFQRCSLNKGVSKETRILIFCFAVLFTLLMILLSVFNRRKNDNSEKMGDKHDRSLKDDKWDVKRFHIFTFTEAEILDAIKEDNLIGKGGSGEVYRVTLTGGLYLAVKHIMNNDPATCSKVRRSSSPMLAKSAGKSKEFEAEVQALSSIRHVNVVKLYCSITSDDSSLLVYEYLPNGSLWDRLHTCGKKMLGWDSRYEIAVGAARGLEYLHHGCERPVIHRDVKSSNILLDEFLKPRIADFGLAKMSKAHINMDSASHSIAGTPGYLAPEYGYTLKVNEKSDVYSFGVVLMELVTGKRPMEPEFGENMTIVSWVYSQLENKETVLNMVDTAISPQWLKEEALKVLRISILCTARLPEQRPAMRAVVKMLEEAEPCKLLGIAIAGKNEAGQSKESV